MKSKLIEHDQFAFFLSWNPRAEPSEITFGFYDPKRYVHKDLHWHKVVNKVFYAIELTDLRIGNESLNLCGPKSAMKRHCTICPDSGTSQMTMPTWAIKKLKQEKHPLLSGPFNCQINAEFNQPDFVFVIGSKEYHVPSQHWMKRTVNAKDRNKSICESKFKQLSVLAHNNANMFILGNTFM